MSGHKFNTPVLSELACSPDEQQQIARADLALQTAARNYGAALLSNCPQAVACHSNALRDAACAFSRTLNTINGAN